jgi:hypothetical protein
MRGRARGKVREYSRAWNRASTLKYILALIGPEIFLEDYNTCYVTGDKIVCKPLGTLPTIEKAGI